MRQRRWNLQVWAVVCTSLFSARTVQIGEVRAWSSLKRPRSSYLIGEIVAFVALEYSHVVESCTMHLPATSTNKPLALIYELKRTRLNQVPTGWNSLNQKSTAIPSFLDYALRICFYSVQYLLRISWLLNTINDLSWNTICGMSKKGLRW